MVRRRRSFVAAVTLAALAVACASDSRPSSSDAATSASPASSPAPGCAPARNELGAGAQTLAFGGEQRSYLLDLPTGYDGSTLAPLVFDFHGFASTGAAEAANTAMGPKGAARGYVVLTPTSDPPQWNAFSAPDQADDFGFVGALLDDVQSRLCIDASRVYAAGHSNGSAFVGFLACKPPLRFAAIAMVSATIPSLCPEATGPSVLVVAGTADPQVPYDGGTVGGSTIQIPGVLDTMHGYADHYHCAPELTADAPVAGVQRTRYQACAPGVAVVLDTIVGGTHAWPGSVAAVSDPTDSDAGHRFDATSEILDFFDASSSGSAVAGPHS